MEQNPINFKQVRDFGEIFNATFTFIRQEYKLLLKAVLYYAVPVLIVAAILGVLVSIKQQQFTNALRTSDLADISDPWSTLGGTYKYIFLSMLVYVLGMCALQCTVLGYIRLYVLKGKDNFTLEDVWSEVKTNIFPVLGISILMAILVVIGFVLCIIPGIYLGISLCLILIAFIYERNGFSDAFNRSFQLTRQNWWLTLGINLVFLIMVYMIMLLLSLPAILLGLKSFLGNFSNTGTSIEFSTAFYIVNSITSVFTYILLTLPAIGLAFHYFSLVEMKERASLHDKIEQIG
jgi:hypothetical protein